MGPYCKFCNNRCFIHPDKVGEWPTEIVEAYTLPKSGLIMMAATCKGGQAFEKAKLGFCYADAQEVKG
jgi:hypothetical protein